MDRAETFAESSVSLSQEGTERTAEGVKLIDDSPNLADVSDTKTVSAGGTADYTFNIDLTYATEIDVEYSASTAAVEATEVTVGGDVVGSSHGTYDVSGYSGTTSVVVTMQNNDSQSRDITVTISRTAFSNVLNGSVIVEWPMPADLAGWDIVPFEVTPNGGTVELYAVDASDGSRLAGPLEDPGDISGLPRSTNIAVEAVLDRPSTSENPRLESVYRRRKIT